MFRDRTGLYYSYRQSYARHPQSAPYPYSARSSTPAAAAGHTLDDARNPLLNAADEAAGTGEDDSAIELDVLPPSWTDVDDEVNQILELIKQKSQKLDKLHQEHILPGFDDRSQQEAIIENLTREITQHFHECQARIKQLGMLVHQADLTSAQINMCKNMQISLATKVQDSSTQFRKKQSAYLKKLRGNRQAELPTTYSAVYPEDDLDVGFSQSQIQQSAQLALNSDDTMIRQREAEITQIAEGILELAEIFRELQTMVIDQGTVLDRIDYNIENMKEHVKAAEVELRQAAHYQQRTQKCKVILFLLLAVLLLAVLATIKIQHRSSSSPSPPSPAPPSTQPTTTPSADSRSL
ncbi:t-SNARE [Myxozyma melibiosi]|uniref:t-SNARE n=1 Tax=Myxozyma melibiosi TaxID=54550 RepID=A0ABR1F1N9_9ASCO